MVDRIEGSRGLGTPRPLTSRPTEGAFSQVLAENLRGLKYSSHAQDRLQQAGRVVGIEVLDHVVVGDGRFVSLRERGALAG